MNIRLVEVRAARELLKAATDNSCLDLLAAIDHDEASITNVLVAAETARASTLRDVAAYLTLHCNDDGPYSACLDGAAGEILNGAVEQAAARGELTAELYARVDLMKRKDDGKMKWICPINETSLIQRFENGITHVSLAREPNDHILPCPFCGSGEVGLYNTHAAAYSVVCQSCGAEMSGIYHADGKGRLAVSQHFKAKKSAISEWNRRAPK